LGWLVSIVFLDYIFDSVTVNVDPLPSPSEAAVIWPLWASTICLIESLFKC